MGCDPVVCRLCDKSTHYFELGMRVAGLLRDESLADDLLEAQLKRWLEVTRLLGNLGVARVQPSPLNPGSAIFPCTLTTSEQAMWSEGQAAERAYKEWTQKFASFKMKASHLIDVPAAKRVRLGA